MERTTLVKTLDLVKAGLSSQEVVAILANFAFDGKTVTSWNTRIGVRMPFKTDFQGCARGSMMLNWLDATTREDVDLKKDEDKQTIYFEGIAKGKKNETFNVVTEPIDSFPKIDLSFLDTVKPIQFDQEFLDAMNKCLISADTLPESDNACVQLIINDHVTMYSTDAETISKYTIRDQHNIKPPQEILLPLEFCKQVDRFAVALETPPNLYVSKELLAAEFGEEAVLFAAQMQPDVTHDIEKIIENATGGLEDLVFFEKPEDYESALLQQLVILGDSNDFGTDLVIEGKQMYLETVASYADVQAPLKLDEKVGDISIVVNPAYLLRVSKLVKSMSVLDNCTVFTDGAAFFHLVSNIQAGR